MTSESEKSSEEVVRDFKKKQETKRNIVIAVVLALLIIYAFNSSKLEDSNNNASSPYPVIEEDLTGWIPTEFNSYSEDPNIGWRWLKDNEFKCTYGESCWGMMVISKDGCDRSLYAEVSILDKNEVQIGYTNDTASQALPMQKTKLVFNTFEDEAETARLTKISCY
jgi:hypothetical protein